MKSNDETLEKCGPNEKIKDLVDLVNKVNKQQSDVLEGLEEFGCNTLNCQETKWTISSWQSTHNLPGFTKIILNFPSSTKVSYMLLPHISFNTAFLYCHRYL